MTAFVRVAMVAALAIAAALASPPAKAQQSPPIVTKAPSAKETSAAETPALAPLAPPEGASSFDAKFTAGITSDYNYRGYTLSNHFPSASANLEVSYWILFGSVNTASVQMPELCDFR